MDNEVRLYAATGMLGAGFKESSLERALTLEPHMLGCDAGGTDGGARALGTGEPHHSRPTTERDLRLLLRASRKAKIPLIIGSAGTAGTDQHVDWMVGILRDIAKEDDLHFRLATLYSEQKKDYVRERLAAGKISALSSNVPAMSDELIENASHIVGMMGAEPFMEALDGGADVIIAGRSSDTAIYASYPLLHSKVEPGLIWHAAKILECGAASVEKRIAGDSMMAWLRPGEFVVEPPAPELRSTPVSVASHSLYETSHPFLMREPSGTIDMSTAKYESNGERGVRVTGTNFIPADEYTIKLEGAELVGYQSFAIGGIRDPRIIGQIRDYVAVAHKAARVRVDDILGKDVTYHLNFRLYGLDGVMGPLEPLKDVVPHELGVLIEVTADSQAIANEILRAVRKGMMHQAIAEYSGSITSLAFPTSAEYDRGPVYQFNMHHVVAPENAKDMYSLAWDQV